MWMYADILKATNGKGVARDVAVPGFSIDTRTLKPGEVYIAIRGETMDGHRFIGDAFEKGAIAAIVDASIYDIPYDFLIHVNNTDQALMDLGNFRRSQLTGHIIGITGSAGKTTTKEMTKAVFERLGKTYASPRSFNNHWGVPLTLANAPLDAEFLIFEMGMNHPGEMSRLTQMVRPEIAIITTIAGSHVGLLGSLDNIARAKAEIFEGMDSDGVLILNGDISQTNLLKELAQKKGIHNILTFGEGAENSVVLKDHGYKGGVGYVEATILGKPISYKLGIAGKHMAMNSLVALTAVSAVGGDISKAIPALESFGYVEGRGQHLKLPWKDSEVTVIDETFNASSMGTIIQIMDLFPCTGRRIAILGDIREQGDFEIQTHKDLKDVITKTNIDGVFCCGELMGHLYEILPDNLKLGHFGSSKEAINAILDYINPGDLVLIKGSHSMKMDTIITAIKGS